MNESNGGVEILVAPRFEQRFQNEIKVNNLKATLELDDISRLIENENKPARSRPFSWDSYYDVDDIHDYIRAVSETYSNYSKLVTSGTSYEGRPLLGLRISTLDGVRKLLKPAVFIESGIHAREWITPAVTTYFINELLTSKLPEMRFLRDSFEWHIFPIVNPDGYHYTHTTPKTPPAPRAVWTSSGLSSISSQTSSILSSIPPHAFRVPKRTSLVLVSPVRGTRRDGGRTSSSQLSLEAPDSPAPKCSPRYVDRYWRKTRSKSPNGCYGADPNRNWGYNWGGEQVKPSVPDDVIALRRRSLAAAGPHWENVEGLSSELINLK
ncbi:Zinc carboxypeptidase A 1 [Eumeta japonica]|uniref:Zinc carboxypeptidase A 1 n=1 Tax=Eumeta variegata TaxID=151549 RepID=A0A4C1ZXW0_EUMVA|nr:Zinc carboxypeptidase A 1 [Eumeta japonica]